LGVQRRLFVQGTVRRHATGCRPLLIILRHQPTGHSRIHFFSTPLLLGRLGLSNFKTFL
jgi:hypothetical protein